MGDQGLNAQFHQRRRRHGDRDDIGRDGGDAHSQQDGRRHGEEKGEEQVAVPKIDDPLGQIQSEPGQGGDPDDDAHHGACHGHPDRRARSLFQGVDQVPEAHPGRFAQGGDGKGHQDGPEGGVQDGDVGEEQHVDEKQEGDDQVSPLLQHIPHPRDFRAGDALQPQAVGPEMDLGEHA